MHIRSGNGIGPCRAMVMVVAFLLLSSVIMMFAAPSSALTSGDYEYELINGDSEVMITGYTGAGGDMTIPDTIEGLPVTYIGDLAFDNLASLTSVALPSGVETIGVAAFEYCTNMMHISMPEVTAIGDRAFRYCTGLSSLSLPETVLVIGNSTFQGCHSLHWVTIPDSVVLLGDSSFYNCASLLSVTIGDNVTSIGKETFYTCGNLVTVGLGASVTSIGDSAFENCVSLSSLDLPDGLMSIGELAFGYCVSLTVVEIPASVASIGQGAFAYCYLLSEIEVAQNNPNYTSSEGVLFSKDLSVLVQYPIGRAGGYELPASVRTVGPYSFSYANFTSFHTGDRLEIIDEYAFAYSSITELEIGNAVTEIGKGAFYTNGLLTYAKIGNSVTLIGDEAFYSCDALENVVVGYSVDHIGTSAFGDFDRWSINLLFKGYCPTLATNWIWGTYTNVNFITWSPDNGFTSYSLMAMAPTEPRSLTATTGNGSVHLEWVEPITDCGEAIDRYVVYVNGTVLYDNVTGLSYDVTGLTNGVEYSFKVTAHNSVGLGDNSTAVLVVPSPPPDPPINLTAVAGDSLVSLSWEPGAYAGPGTLVYHLFRDGTEIWNGTATSYDDTNVSNGITYAYQVAAENDIGWSLNSSEASATPETAPVPPGTPAGLQAEPGDAQVTLSWTAPGDQGGSSITGYKVYRGTSSLSLVLIATVTGTSYIDGDVVNDQQYFYAVSAISADGEGERTDAVAATPEEVSAEDGDGGGTLMVIALVIAIAAVAAVVVLMLRRRK